MKAKERFYETLYSLLLILLLSGLAIALIGWGAGR